jgi:hypothetical protein
LVLAVEFILFPFFVHPLFYFFLFVTLSTLLEETLKNGGSMILGQLLTLCKDPNQDPGTGTRKNQKEDKRFNFKLFYDTLYDNTCSEILL